LARQSSRHQFASDFRENHFPMIPDVVGVCVGHEGGLAFVLWIQPKIQLRKKNPAFENDLHLAD
jgi:hypothetical protein